MVPSARSVRSKTLVLVLAAWLSLAAAGVVTYDWDVTYVNVNPDGKHERRAIGVNNAWPLPPLTATVGDTLIINVKNSLDVPTGLHSHGLFQNRTGYMDGAAGVTQCPIPPGGSFTYSFVLQQWGTYWVHAHFMAQYVDGMRAPLVIHNSQEVYRYDDEFTVTLEDWYHEESPVLVERYKSRYNPSGTEPVPQAVLINQMITPSFPVKPNTTYRVRIINMSALTMFYFLIDGHEMDVIEVDGVDVEKYHAEKGIPVSAAQRYSVLITTRNSTSQNFLMRAYVEPHMIDQMDPLLEPLMNSTAIIVYNQNVPLSATDHVPLIWDADGMFPMRLEDTVYRPLEVIPSIGPVKDENRIVLNVNFDIMTDGRNHGMFNNVTYIQPKVPTLLTALTMGEAATLPAVYGRHTNAFVINHGEEIELVVNNWDEGSHPFHLHGHVFQVLGLGEGGYDWQANPVQEHPNPARRDTIMIPSGGHAVMRFTANNPGTWLFHCHIEWHMENGLVATFIEAPLEAQTQMALPQQVLDHCSAQGILPGMNAAKAQGLDLSNDHDGPQPLPGVFDGRGIVAFALSAMAAATGISAITWYGRNN